MWLISREAALKVGKDAWNALPGEAFGYLLGRFDTQHIYAALPCQEHSTEHLLNAERLGFKWHMEVIGGYASMSLEQDRSEYPMPPFIDTAGKLLILYQPLCCPHHSRFWLRSTEGRWLTYGENYQFTPGKRSTNTLNQKRILSVWHGPSTSSGRTDA